MTMNRYELHARHAGEPFLVVAVYASSDAEAIEKVRESVPVAMESGASHVALYEIEIGRERLVKQYELGN